MSSIQPSGCATKKREEISFHGRVCSSKRFGDHGTICTVSFCGENKMEWDNLVKKAARDELSTACVFLTTETDGLGKHVPDPESADGRCFCHALYGARQFWGCWWFSKWAALVEEARKRGQIFCVFYRQHADDQGVMRGHLAKVGAENTTWSPGEPAIEGEVDWDELATAGIGKLSAMEGLGVSQKGEVAWLKRKGISFMRIDVNNGAPSAEATTQILEARADALCDLVSSKNLAIDIAKNLRGVLALNRAEKLMRDLARELGTRLGADHADTLGVKNDLATLLHFRGKTSEARRMYKEVIDGSTRHRGADHTFIASVKENLAGLLGDLSEYSEAQRIYKEVLDVRTRRQGADHLETLSTKMRLNLQLNHLGKSSEARPICRQIVDDFTRRLGADHHTTLNAKENFARLLKNVGETSEAERIYREVIDCYTRQVGDDQIDTLKAKMGLAAVLRDECRRLPRDTKRGVAILRGTRDEARRLMRDVVSGFTRHLGADHKDTLMANMYLARLLKDIGAHAVVESQRLALEVVDGFTKCLGADNEWTVIAKKDLAVLYWGWIDYWTRICGPCSHETLKQKLNLADLLKDLGEIGKARGIYREVVDASTRKYGAKYSVTLRAKEGLANVGGCTVA